MARPPLAMGTHGSISVNKRPSGSSFVARCRFRDFDGVTRWIERAGRSKTAALAVLQDELRSRAGSPAAPLRPQNTFERAAELKRPGFGGDSVFPDRVAGEVMVVVAG